MAGMIAHFKHQQVSYRAPVVRGFARPFRFPEKRKQPAGSLAPLGCGADDGAIVRGRFEGKARRFLDTPYLQPVCVTAISSNRSLEPLDLREAAACELSIDTASHAAGG
jgi:hypothetical protein